MPSPAHAAYAAILARYQAHFPDEGPALERLRHRLTLAPDLHDRGAMAGHITGSGIVLDGRGRILLIFHETLGRWLQPGGHVDPGEWAWDATLRELREETGAASAEIVPWCNDLRVPFDIDIHTIPARPAKGEAVHLHFDFRYLVRLGGTLAARGPAGEIGAIRWFAPGADDDALACVRRAIGKLARGCVPAVVA
jgi:8-oxo-dGTP pyrophosphatase MutT (NUDIX family)